MEEGHGRGEAGWAPIAGAALLLAAGVVVALALRGSAESPSAAPAACITAWNEDRAAVSLGRHQYSDHGYNRAEVTRLDPATLATGEGDCTVIFPARLLDPEPIAAAMVLRNDRWIPLAQLAAVTQPELAELQAAALDAANAALGEDGVIAADEEG